MNLLKIAAGVAAAATLIGAELKTEPSSVVAHEWGTFTSVAREDGQAVAWAPLNGAGDLPCFVERSGIVHKTGARGLVRMETPVIYFYSQEPAALSVHVDFKKGYLTEWYPASKPLSSISALEWHVDLAPGKDLSYPQSKGPSRYYAARNTDATPLRIGGQTEKMIFYRGYGEFTPPLTARYDEGGKLYVRNLGPDPIPFVIAFENHNGALGYRIAENVADSATIEPLAPSQDLSSIRETLATRLTGLGLYPKEAQAMVETWTESWFGEGARVFYIVPRPTVDALLPLKIDPAPSQVQRVFVGRVDLLSPQSEDTIIHALRAGDSQTLSEFGRFLEPFAAQLMRTRKDLALSPAAQKFLQAVATGHEVTADGYGGAWEASQADACIE